MDLGLQDKIALVTGASRGIGAAAVDRLVREGSRVVAVSRRPSPDRTDHPAVRQVAADLSDEGGAAGAVAAAVAEFGGIDILVNNVGGGDRLSLAPFAELTDADWTDAFATNLFAAVRTTRAALPWLERAGGVVVNVSSIGAHRVDGPPLAYNVAKAALTAFGRGVAPELAGRGVRTVTVTPGPTRTAMWDRFAAASGAPLDAVLAGVPDQLGMLTGRLIEPAEVADVIAYLSSPLAAGVVGANVVIDGGALRAA